MRQKTSGNTCARPISPTACSKTTPQSSTLVSSHGVAFSTSSVASTPSPAGIGLLQVNHSEVWYYIIADNEIALKAGWDRETLAIELQGLIDLGFEVELTGFEPAEIDLILGDWQEASSEPAAPEDQCAEPPEDATVSRPGDLWILGSQ